MNTTTTTNEYNASSIQIKSEMAVGSPWLVADTIARDYKADQKMILRLIEVSDRLGMDYSYFIEKYLEKSNPEPIPSFEQLYRAKLLRQGNDAFEYETL
ncbi:hypothetical protein [Endozoicomonas sp. ONNA1]|uniref:hypothetical protein n=1 Tax=Endozoicomonas sp. ONNA1 TaxID=2828740 RepID=UPI0021492450|nr:hypothetical protein [Endozoicomonas sp. ONNA1]